MKRKDWSLLIIMAFCGQFMFTVLLLIGLKMTSATEAGLITSTTPAAMGLVTCFVLKERLFARQWIGIALALFGMMSINAFPAGEIADHGSCNHLLGNLLVCLAVVGEAVFLLLKKMMAPAVSSMMTTGILCALGLAMFLPPAIYQSIGFNFRTVGLSGWGAIAYFGVVFTVVAYFLWFSGVSRVSGGTAGIFSAVMPVSAVGLSVLFLGESLTFSSILGVVFVLGAIVLISLEPREKHKAVMESRLK